MCCAYCSNISVHELSVLFHCGYNSVLFDGGFCGNTYYNYLQLVLRRKIGVLLSCQVPCLCTRTVGKCFFLRSLCSLGGEVHFFYNVGHTLFKYTEKFLYKSHTHILYTLQRLSMKHHLYSTQTTFSQFTDEIFTVHNHHLHSRQTT